MTFFLLLSFCCFIRIWASNKFQERIIHGSISSIEQFPFAVVVLHEVQGEAGYCAGALLNDKWVLTAAHCIQNADKLTVLMGANKLNDHLSTKLEMKNPKYVIHPEYKVASYIVYDDIGLIKLPASITFSDRIKPVDLPSSPLRDNEKTTALGWGLIENQTEIKMDNELRHVNLTTIDKSDCEQIYHIIVTKNSICAIGVGNQGLCDGDSGGPLIKTSKDGKIVVVGVASYIDDENCQNHYASVFARTYNHLKWINQVMNSTNGFSTSPLLLFILVVNIICGLFN